MKFKICYYMGGKLYKCRTHIMTEEQKDKTWFCLSETTKQRALDFGKFLESEAKSGRLEMFKKSLFKEE